MSYNPISLCPKCASYLNYDGDNKEYYCLCCDYVEFEKWTFTRKFRKELD